MQLNFKNLTLKEDLGRAEALHWLHLFFVTLALSIEVAQGSHGFGVIFTYISLAAFYYLFNQTKKNLYYSFWTFAGILAIYLVIEVFQAPFLSSLFWIYLWALVLLMLESYILSSPIYYPQVSWWEYDFRYRDDVRVFVTLKSEELFLNEQEARLTDLRRGAGCVSLFEELTIGDVIEIKVDPELFNVSLSAQIMSKRLYSVGRPWKYGVRFNINKSENDDYKKLCRYWSSKRRHKLNKKFQHEKS